MSPLQKIRPATFNDPQADFCPNFVERSCFYSRGVAWNYPPAGKAVRGFLPASHFCYLLINQNPASFLILQPVCVEDEMWIDFAIFLVACQVLTFGIIRIVEAAGLI